VFTPAPLTLYCCIYRHFGSGVSRRESPRVTMVTRVTRVTRVRGRARRKGYSRRYGDSARYDDILYTV